MKQQFRRGVASFYIVAFTTLILTVVATGFATVILSEMTRTTNDDLSQSAYDSALAGVEDAKLAYANYRRCKEAGEVAQRPNGDGSLTCAEIMYYMENPNCYMVGHMLGRIPELEEGEVMVGDTLETGSGNEVKSKMNQAYTCVEIRSEMDDYRAGLSSTSSNRMIQLNFDHVLKKDGTPLSANDIAQVRLSWYLIRDDKEPYFGNYVDADGRVAFQPAKSTQVVAPPTIELQLIQTAETFRLTDFDIAIDSNTRNIDRNYFKSNLTGGGSSGAAETLERSCDGICTDRATLYLVPINNDGAAKQEKNSYTGVWSGTENLVSAAQVAKTNDRFISNKPYGVYCSEKSTNEFMCSATIELPKPVGGVRNNETFMFAVELPYKEPDTEFSMEFLYWNGSEMEPAKLRDAQVVIDSTGRANDLVRRVETRLETSDTSFAYPMFALQLLDPNNTLKKDMTVTSEHNFYQ